MRKKRVWKEVEEKRLQLDRETRSERLSHTGRGVEERYSGCIRG